MSLARKAAGNPAKGFLDSISCHAFNKDKSMVAVCPNTEEVFIYECKAADPKDWTKVYTLTGEVCIVVLLYLFRLTIFALLAVLSTIPVKMWRRVHSYDGRYLPLVPHHIFFL